jgi:multimeric flavodoxin WrbA
LKVLGLVCSPRSGGNTEILVRKALESAKNEGADVEIWDFVGKEVKPCEHCKSCYETGECKIMDDMQDLYPKLKEADGIILGSPVYFWSVTAQAKLLMDRTYALRRPTNLLHGKVGGAIAVAGRRGQLEALMLMNNFFLGQGMVPASLGVDGRGSEKGEVVTDEISVTGAVNLGKKVVDLINIHG